MDKEGKTMKYRNILKKRILAGLLAGAAACAAAPALAASGVVPNTQLPQGGNFVAGGGTIGAPSNGQMTITQNTQNGVIKWDGGFNIGANATVNFEGPQNGYNTLNYDASGNMSQIYGAINANNNGNIYIVNAAGVEIGNSAQINVGSLYVPNRNLDDALKNLTDAEKANPNITNILNAGTTTDAALMSLGNINASSVTFDGGRVVIDTERLKTGDEKMAAENIKVNTTDAGSVVIGYDAYDKENETYAGKDKNISDLATVMENGTAVTDLKGYMWVEDVAQLQKIDTNLGGNYALRNSIDATATQEWNNGAGFKPIGIDSTGKVIVENSKYGFHGNFDGLSYNIFNLNISRADAVNVGLFGVLHEAEINNVTFVGGAITGGNVVGSLAGAVLGNTHVNNVMNSASVTGGADVGGIIGYSGDEIDQVEDSDKPITVGSADAHFSNMVNTGTVVSSGTSDGNGGTTSDAGGLIGNLYQGTLDGTSYNLGSVTGEGHNVGGLVGHAYASKLGDGTNLIYNRLDVTGAYNVGGIVGQMEGTTVQNAENSGSVTATGYTDGKYYYHSRNIGKVHVEAVDVRFANAGGIAGNAANVEGRESKIENVLNTGDISSIEWSIGGKTTLYRYTGGNVGGIVGSAVDTNITNATNRENNIRGAINVGGVAGYFANSDDTNATKYTVTNGITDGGDILGSGLTSDNGIFATEIVRPTGGSNEKFNIGNIGGVVGYMDGDNVYITASTNRGTVHTKEPGDPAKVQQYEKAANVGGIVGKIDRSTTKDSDVFKQEKTDEYDPYTEAAVSNSYNTGDVMGYTGVGGIAGMMYNGEIAGSYNLGYLRTTRQSALNDSIDALNMGGIVGDTTENSGAKVILYDVYNKGQIGDETYTYYGRHVGGIVGRLSGTVEKAYNTGAIYNGYNVVGGIVGWVYEGSIKNSFNTGNITVVNQNNASSQVGGIAGAASTNVGVELINVYNLGTLRSFKNNGAGANAIGGILGIANGMGKGEVSITNAYTTGNIWAGNQNGDNSYSEDTSNSVRSILGRKEGSAGDVQIENTYYIRPDKENNLPFTDLSENGRNNSNKAIDFDKKDDINQYKFDGGITNPQANGNMGANVDESFAWRIYAGSTPILNTFLPNTEDYFAGEKEGITPDLSGIGSIQYGTAYDPLLTIINANGNKANLEFNWIDLGANNAAGIAVYGAGLTLNDFKATGGSGYYAGLLYADGALSISADGDAAFSSAAELYGSSVTIDAKGDVTIYGDVTATGNIQDGTSWDEDAKKYTGTLSEDENNGKINISGGSVDIYGQLTSAKKDGEPVRVPGINGMAEGWDPSAITDEDGKPIENAHENPNIAMSDIGDRFGYTTSGSAVDGDITITATDASDGHVNVYYGNQEEGFIDAAGSLSVTAAGDIYMDSDLKVGGGLTLTSPGEMVLDLTNIGQVQADKGLVTDALTGLHEFMHQFETGGNTISFQTNTSDGTAADAKLTVDMWNDEKNAYDLTKYDTNDHTFKDELDQLNFTVQGDEAASAAKYTYIWVSTGEQLAGIQQAADTNSDFLGYNFALKNDIDASQVQDYKAIGTGSEYKGTFDGRDNRIIGLDTTKTSTVNTTQTLTNAGIFDTIGAGGTVEDLRVYSGTFTGKDNAGAVAGVNNGTISNVTAFGNVVSAMGSSNSTELKKDDGSTVNVGAAGGIAGVNTGTIDNVTVSGTATAADGEEGNTALSTAGGIAGINQAGAEISDSTSNSAVNASAESTYALGGVTGVNAGKLNNVDSLGVTTGLYKLEGHNSTKENQYSDNVGGIAGINQAGGTVESAYNESIVSGRNNVGGILGVNHAVVEEGEDSLVSNVANASSVTGEAGNGAASNFVGGLVGDNEGSITNGRNNGEITGNNHVGGLVGNNGVNSTLTNLTNDSAAAITGDNYVGGIAGSNAGKITASSVDEEGHVIEGNDNLINRGTITGVQYVGGVAGENTGTITNTNNDVDLHVKEGATDAKYFGGVAGINGSKDGLKEGTIENATNSATIIAENADYVGGIVGWNTSKGVLQGMGNSNEGNVTGNNYVGGVAGKNDAAVGSASEQVVITNSGKVTANGGGAGGIFGVNDGVISNAHLTNEGNVTGTTTNKEGDETGTGGIFGINHKNITDSILENLTGNVTINTEAGQIVQNVGGLIGINTGDVSTSSLKNEANITVTAGDGQTVENIGGLIGQNTGDITGGRTDAEGNDVGYYKYQIYNNGTITVEGTGTNIGGLIGTNEAGATVIAGYNTGVIHASGSENVGGIAGTNTGELNQVFNTVINVNEDGSTAPGSITGSTNVGGIAGTNEKGAEISNAYNTTAVSGSLENAVVGSIAGTNDGTISNVYGSKDGELVVKGLVGNGNATHVYNSEKGFGEGGSSIHKDGEEADEKDLWRQYGDNNPILKVFLTQLTVNETAVINGEEVSLNNYLHLVYNGKEQDINIQDLIDKGFITGPDGMKKEDEGGNLVSAVSDAHKNTMKNDGTPNSDLLYNTGNKKNAGNYSNWIASAQIAEGNDGNPNNLGYDIDFNDNEITIGKATIEVSLEDIYRIYGNSQMYTDKSHNTTASGYDSFWSLKTTTEVEGAKEDLQKVIITVNENSDGAVSNLDSGKTTINNVGDYDWGVTVDISGIAANYQLKGADSYATSHSFVGNQLSHVDRANIEISANPEQVYVGTKPQFSGTVISDVLVNGDTIFDGSYRYGTEYPVDTSKPGSLGPVIGIHFGNTYLNDESSASDWDNVLNGLFKNYNVEFKPGTLTVQDLPEGMPEISDIPSIERHWNFLFDDNPWDRNRDFRERKAEVHYIAGGMTL